MRYDRAMTANGTSMNIGTTREYGADQLRLLARVARMYHERGMRQPQIAADLHISQSRVSRLLRQASEQGNGQHDPQPDPAAGRHRDAGAGQPAAEQRDVAAEGLIGGSSRINNRTFS